MEEDAEREFDHTQWKDPGIFVRPKTTYSLAEDDPPPSVVDGRKLADWVEDTGTLLDVARSETREIEARLRKTGIPPLSSSHTEGASGGLLVDRELEIELRESLKAQIAEEEAIHEASEEPGIILDSSAQSELQSRPQSRSVEESEVQGKVPVIQEPQQQPRLRFAKSPIPEYKLPKGEEVEASKGDSLDGEAESISKRRSRFAAPEPQPETEPGSAETGELQWQAEASAPEEPKRPSTFYEILQDVQGAHFHALYDAHARLEEKERDRVRPQTIAYLAKSRSIVEAGRVKTLFRQTPVEQWTNEMLSAIVLVFLRTGEQTHAFDAYRTGIRQRGLTGGFEYLLIDSVNKHQWHVALDAWLVYCNDLAGRTPRRIPNQELLKPFSSLESLGGLYFLFERYLAAGERKVERFMDAKPVSKEALYMFRRMFAKAALESHCPPKQARVILDWWYNQPFYNKYIGGMVQRWQKKEITSDTVRGLIPIYEDFRNIPNLKISESILSRMFQVCYPHTVQTLEQLHEDWVRMRGDLDSWGYRNFMKFYAHRGDAERVKALWEDYRVSHPSDLTHARSFVSIINAYAQSGDTQGAEAELERMSKKYRVAPNISTMNALLKCYMRKGDYEATLACFKKIAAKFKPDSYMYAHMMAMCSKKGDLNQTIEFFNNAQDRRVPITKEMVLALVVAYCGNRQSAAAEELVRRLADSDITSTAIWNHIVFVHAKQGHLSKCYRVLDEMKERKIEWDGDTIDCLLQALAQVKQITPAFEVLRTTVQNQPMIVRPDHYTTVMVGAARSRDVVTADMVYDMLTNAEIPIPFNAIVAYTALMLERKPNAKRIETLPVEMVEALRRYVHGIEKLDIWKRKQQTRRVSWCIELLIDFREFDLIEEVVSLYTQLFPEYKDGNLPPDILASLMQGYQRDNNHERIIALWNDSWHRLHRDRAKSGEEGVYPAHQYDLDRLVFRLADAYRSLGTSKGLASAIQQVHDAGFKLTVHTWDRVVGALAITGNWKTGVHWCEKVLMGNWAGWGRRLNLQERRARANPRVLWPERRTVLALREGWIAERQLAAWSGTIARSLFELDIDYPKTVNAFRDALEPAVPGGPWIITREITMEEFLKPLPLRELKLMDKELSKYLEDEEKILDQKKSPFRSLSEQDDRLRSLNRGEMTKLKGLLDQFLAHTKPETEPETEAKTETKSQQPAPDSASG